MHTCVHVCVCTCLRYLSLGVPVQGCVCVCALAHVWGCRTTSSVSPHLSPCLRLCFMICHSRLAQELPGTLLCPSLNSAKRTDTCPIWLCVSSRGSNLSCVWWQASLPTAVFLASILVFISRQLLVLTYFPKKVLFPQRVSGGRSGSL